jgi:type VI secretion system secreted protein Hcp
MAIYMKYGDLEGDVTADGYEGWIECSSLQFGVGRGISSPVGKSSDREASTPSVSEIVVTKRTDKTSPNFFQESVEGEGKTVEFHFTRTAAGTIESYFEITINNTLISGYSLSSAGDAPSESLSLNFTKIEVKYIPINDDHSTGTPVPAGYDLAAGTTT